MRAAINAACEMGHGEYLLKCDAHIAFCEGFDELLKANCDGDWVVTPVRYSLDHLTWSKSDKRAVHHEYLSYPYVNDEMVGLHAKYYWYERDHAHMPDKEPLSENMAWQGSCWFMPMEYATPN